MQLGVVSAASFPSLSDVDLGPPGPPRGPFFIEMFIALIERRGRCSVLTLPRSALRRPLRRGRQRR
ncbi:hypothetical protein BURKHO8Y_70110 [Burkholderia sp. 8Y]|nr:hypothetical protein BURKHO8Y_70110 [Burkholderia sp. 8Y]